MSKPPVNPGYGCFPFLCDRLKKIFPFLRQSKAQKMERHRGKLSPTIYTKTPSHNNHDASDKQTRKLSETRKVSETRKTSTASSRSRKISDTRKISTNSDGYHRNRMPSIDNIRKTSNSSTPPSPRRIRSFSQGEVTSRSRKTSTAYAKKLNDAIDQDDGCQPKYSAAISAVQPPRSPTKPLEYKELNDVSSMSTINEQQSVTDSSKKSNINRLRWKRTLSVVKK